MFHYYAKSSSWIYLSIFRYLNTSSLALFATISNSINKIWERKTKPTFCEKTNNFAVRHIHIPNMLLPGYLSQNLISALRPATNSVEVVLLRPIFFLFPMHKHPTRYYTIREHTLYSCSFWNTKHVAINITTKKYIYNPREIRPDRILHINTSPRNPFNTFWITEMIQEIVFNQYSQIRR